MSYPDARYRSDKGEISAVYRPADQKPDLAIGLGRAVRYLAARVPVYDCSVSYSRSRSIRMFLNRSSRSWQ